MKGGKREGSGRKPALHKTTTIAFRVREDWAQEITATVKKWIKDLENEN